MKFLTIVLAFILTSCAQSVAENEEREVSTVTRQVTHFAIPNSFDAQKEEQAKVNQYETSHHITLEHEDDDLVFNLLVLDHDLVTAVDSIQLPGGMGYRLNSSDKSGEYQRFEPNVDWASEYHLAITIENDERTLIVLASTDEGSIEWLRGKLGAYSDLYGASRDKSVNWAAIDDGSKASQRDESAQDSSLKATISPPSLPTSLSLQSWLSGKMLTRPTGDGTVSFSFCSDGRYFQTNNLAISDSAGSIAGRDSVLGSWSASGSPSQGTIVATDPNNPHLGEIRLPFAKSSADVANVSGYPMRTHAHNPFCH